MASNAVADSSPAASIDLVDVKSNPQSLHSAVNARRAEYVQPHRIRVKVGSWNVAACPGTDKDLASWFVAGKGVDRRLATVDIVHNTAIEREESADSSLEAAGGGPDPNAVRLVGGDKVGLYVLGLQEAEDLNVATQYVTRVVYADSGPSTVNRWKTALEAALPPGYVSIASEQMLGLVLLIYAAQDVAASISNVSISSVGTGLLGYMGNKGSVSARIVLGETTRMTFVNCHLASGHDAANLERRVWDVGQIMSRTQFKPVSHHGVPPDSNDPEKIGDEDFVFWFGDLNFRLDGLPGDDIRRLLMLHTRGEYDLSRKSDKTGSEEEALGGEDPIVLRSRSSSSPSPPGGDSDGGRTTSSGFSKTQIVSSPSTSTTDGRDKDRVITGDADSDSSVSLPDPDDFLPNPSDDPASLQATLDSLLPHDQLRRLMKQGRVFHEGWREGPITFLPSYKYDVGTVGLFDTSEKKRSPSWCDRILYRTRTDKEAYDKKVKEAEEARRRDEEMRSQGIDEAAEDDEVLFDYDPDTDGDESPALTRIPPGAPPISSGGSTYASSISPSMPPDKNDMYDYDENYDENDDGGATAALDDDDDATMAVVTKDGFHDRIHLDIYTSHQRVQSSDHKPIISVFSLDYDGAVPELKAKVHAEVARELDRAENEGRPTITIIIEADTHQHQTGATAAQPDDHDHPPPSPTEESDDAGEAIDYGHVRFLRKKTCLMTIANTGRVPATFSFVAKPTTEDDFGGTTTAGGGVSSQWLTTLFIRTDLGPQPSSGSSPNNDDDRDAADADSDAIVDLGREVVLEPGETVKAAVELLVDDIGLATRLNAGEAVLDDVLVLRVVEGRDHFIPVRATWTPTCIGRSVDELIRVPDGGIRSFIAGLVEEKRRRAKAKAKEEEDEEDRRRRKTEVDKDEDEDKGKRLAMRRRNSSTRSMAEKTTVGSIPYDLEVRCAAPKELFKLTEAVEMLTERALADESMLSGRELPGAGDSPGWPLAADEQGGRSIARSSSERYRADLAAAVVEMLDRDRPLAEAFDPETPSADRLEVVSRVLLMFLRGLTDGVVPVALWTRIEQAGLPSSFGAAGGAAAGGGGSGGGLLQPHHQHQQDEDDKAAVLDVLASAPNHNISFVFLTTTLAKVLAELAPLSRADVEALKAAAAEAAAATAMGRARRSLSFRRGVVGAISGGGGAANAKAAAEAMAALGRRRAKERRFADVLARNGVCRAGLKGNEAAGTGAGTTTAGTGAVGGGGAGGMTAKGRAEKERERKASGERIRAVLELFLRRSREELM